MRTFATKELKRSTGPAIRALRPPAYSPAALGTARAVRNILQRFSTQDCSNSDKQKIRESHNQAIAMLEKAIERLTANPVTAETQRHFANHFGGYGTWRRDVVVGHFRTDLDHLQEGDMTYECESECDPGEPAYTY